MGEEDSYKYNEVKKMGGLFVITIKLDPSLKSTFKMLKKEKMREIVVKN